MNLFSLNDLGQARANALLAWQRPLKARAQQKMPKALSTADVTAISAKYATKRPGLVSQKEGLGQQVKEAKNTVRTRYKSLRGTVDVEEFVATGKMQSKKEIIAVKYKERYSSCTSIRRKLDEDFKSSFAELDERSSKDRRNLFALHWEEEKIRRRLIPLKRICFSGYLRHIAGV